MPGFIYFAVVICVSLFVSPECALAKNSSEVYAEFNGYELPRLFEKTGSLSSCDFVMRDYATGQDVYLRVRDQYKSRYAKLVGEDCRFAFRAI